MASTQKWRSYGGISHFESNNSVSFNNLTVGNLSIKSEYIGNFGIRGSLFVNDYATVHGNIKVYGNSEIYGKSTVKGISTFLDDVNIDGNVVVNKSVTINGQLNIGYGFNFDNDINVNGNIGMAGKYIFIGGLNPTYNYGKLVCNTNATEKFIGINQPIETQNILPGSMLEIYCDSESNNGITALNAYSNSLNPTQSIIISNLNYQGTIFYTDISQSSMYMFNDNTIPTTTIMDYVSGFKYVQPKIIDASNASPDYEMTYRKGGDLLIRVKKNTFLTSKTIIGKSNVQDVSSELHEKTIIYADPSNANPFNYSYYETNDYLTNNSLTLIDETNNNKSNTGLNLVAKDSLTGMKICGGSYILNNTKSMGSIQLSDDGCGNSIPVQTMITGDIPSYRRTSTGMNTYAPNTNYTLNINGKTNITDGEIVKIQDVSFQLNGLVGCARNPDYIVGYGSPNVTVVTNENKDVHKHPFIYTSDGGTSWSISDISGDKSSGIHQNLLSTNYVSSYNSNYSFAVYGGNQNLFYTSDGAANWHIFIVDITETITNITTIRVIDMSNSVMMAFTNQRATNNYLSYGIMPDVSYMSLYSGDNPDHLVLGTNSFIIPMTGNVTGMDSYDHSYIFITGSFGIYKYNVNSILGTINSTGTQISEISCNSLYTYKTYTNDILDPDPSYTIFVGNGYITTTYDCGNTLNVHNVSGNIKSVYIYNSYYAIAIGTFNNTGVIYVTFDHGQNWRNMSSTPLLNTSGVSNLLIGSGQNLTSVCIPKSSKTFLINRVDAQFIDGLQLGHSKVFYCYFPNLYNIDTYTVLDVCGSVFIDGYMNLSYDANILGSISVSKGNILINQNGGDSYDVSSGVLIIPNNSGASITGNVTIGGNLICKNLLSSNILNLNSLDGNINIGSSSNIYPNIAQTITIGNQIGTKKTDNIEIYASTLYFDVSYVTSFGYNLINLISSNLTNLTLGYTNASSDGPGLYFYDTSNNIIDPSHTLIIGGLTVTSDGNGFLFWPPYDYKTRLDVSNFKLNSGINNSIVKISKSTYSDSSYVICNQPDIDISHLILSTNVNAINNVQKIQTDISVNGNLYVSGGFTVVNSNNTGVIKILGSSMDSYSTDSGSLQLNGGIGINGNIFTNGNVYISNTSSNAFTVNGNSKILGNLNIGNNLTVDGSYAYFANKVYINNTNGIGPTCLSMTDFSSNVMFHSSTESTSTGTGSIIVSGGAGVVGNINIGRNVYVNNKLYASGDCSLNGYVYMPSGNIYFGPSLTHLSMTDFSSNVIFHSTADSTSTDSGSIVISGGVGISKNMYIGNSLFFGPTSTHLSMTDFSSNVIFHSTADSTSTDSGSIVISGGVGISKNMYIGDSLFFGPTLTHLSMTDFSSNVTFHSTSNSTSTGTGCIIVSGGAGINGNLYVGSGITVDGSYAYFANNVYINTKNGLGPTCLSMTDFSSNVTLHSTSESTSTNSGSLIVSGGIGVVGNIYVGNSIYFGPSLTHLSMTDFSSNVTFYSTSNSTNTGTGSIVVRGGAGINSNLYVGSGITVDGSYAYFANNVFINAKNGLGPTCLSMTDFSSNATFYSTSNSTSTGTGSIVVRGGAGINSNLFVGSNLYVGSGITVDGSYAYFADKVYINAKNGLGLTSLSMTDFSSNVTFHSISESTSTGTGSIIVKGGIGVTGNLNVGKNGRILSTTDSTNTSTGSLIISGGLGIAGNLFASGYNGGTVSNINLVNLGRTVCYSLQSVTSINISGGLNIYGNVPGTNGVGSLYLNGTSGIYSGGSIYCGDTTPSTALNTGAFQVLGGASVGGNLYVGGTVTAPVINQTSDYRIKNNIIELDHYDTVDNLHPVKYYNKITNRNDIGFLAHEVQEIYPFLVEGIKDGTDYQSLNYIGIIGILVKEIKELKRRMFELENT